MTQTATKPKKTVTKTYGKKKSSKKPLTLGEFRAWLSGVEEMQTGDWYPDPQQWKTIRAKIDEVIDNPVSSNFNRGSREVDEPRMIRPAGPSLLAGAPPQMMQNPNRPAEVMIPGGGQNKESPVARIKTPDIDSTRGYTAAFE